LAQADRIHELDINPVLVRSNDSVIAVDALVVLSQAEEHQP
jgi:hypothetical protein